MQPKLLQTADTHEFFGRGSCVLINSGKYFSLSTKELVVSFSCRPAFEEALTVEEGPESADFQ